MIFGLPRQLWAAIAFFFLFGAAFGLWGGHLASIEDRIGDSESAYGNALVGLAIGLILSAVLVGPLSKRFGTSHLLRVTWLIYFLVMMNVFWVPSAYVLFIYMFGIGVMGGMIDVAVNAQVAIAERHLGKSLLSRAHAVWSLGGFLGAGSAGVFLSFGIRDAHIVGSLVIMALVAVWASLNLYTKAEEEAEEDHPEHARDSYAEIESVFNPWTSPTLILMGSIALFGLLIESGMMDWTPIYFSDFRQADPQVSAFVFASFSAVMFLARMGGDWVREFIRDKHILVVGAAFSGVFILLGITAANDVLAIVLMSIGGIGIAAVYPLVTSRAAAFRGPGQTNASAAGNIAVVTGIGYGAILVGPPVIGYISEHVSLWWGMALVAACGPVMTLLTMMLPRQQQPGKDKNNAKKSRNNA